MARNSTGADTASVSGQRDRRVRKTTSALREALHELMSEKPYDEIVVKEILYRADVGRSTFYTHFRDKDDLLASAIDEIVETARSAPSPRSGPWYERVLWFSEPIFAHHERRRTTHGSGARHWASPAGHRHLSTALIDAMSESLRDPGRATVGRTNVPTRLVLEFVASTFVLIFTWWLTERHPIPAAQADRLFRSFVTPGLEML